LISQFLFLIKIVCKLYCVYYIIKMVIGMRKDKINYYLDIAQSVSERSTCLRRHFGAVIVKNDEIISTGYNGAPRGRKNCDELGYCYRDKLNIPRGERYELCRSVHAEQNAIISASRKDTIGATLYMVGVNAKTGEIEAGSTSCMMCKRVVINAGIEKVIVREPDSKYSEYSVEDWINNDDSLNGEFGY
jgi:dCMP deaminase